MNTKKWIHLLIAALCAGLLTSCGGISGTGGPSRAEKEKPEEGRAVLGPIVGATVSIRDIEDINTIACSATTTDHADLARAGAISFEAPCIYASHIYLVTVSGGDDIDFDDSGERDTTPTPNRGEFRALLTGEQLLQNDWKTNALTESVFQALQYSLQQLAQDPASVDIEAIISTIDGLAAQFISADLNGDGIVNRFDIAQWHPVEDDTAATNNDKMRFVTGLIHQNLNRTLSAIPDAASLAGHIDTLAPARQVMRYNSSLLVTTDTAILIYRYENGTSTLQSVLPLGWVYDMTLSGSDLFVALGENGIKQLDISDLADIKVSKSWPDHAERIANIGTHVVFSVESGPYQQSLKAIFESGEARTLATVDQVEDNRKYFGPEYFQADLRQPLLTVAGNTVYWAPANAVLRFTLQDDDWQALTDLQPDIDQFDARIIKDIEVIGAKIYIVETGLNTADANWLSDVPPRSLWPTDPPENGPGGEYFRQIADQFFALLKNRVVIMDITDPATPVGLTSVDVEGLDALRQINGVVVGLGKTDISIRNADTLQAESSLPLPASFSGFYSAHGLTSMDDLIVVAAKENGILLLDPNRVPDKSFHGKTYIDGPIANAEVVVRQLPASTERCRATSDEAGAITLPASCVEAEGYYEIDVSGGDQVVSGISTPLSGHLRSVIHGSQFQYNLWVINPLTTLARDALSTTLTADPDAISNGYEELQHWWISSSISQTRRLNEELLPDSYQWRLDAQQWQQLKQRLLDGNYEGSQALQTLTGASSFQAFVHPVQGVAATDGALFIARNNGIDIYEASPTTSYVGVINDISAEIAASGDSLAVFEPDANALRIYDASDIHNVVLAKTIATDGLFGADAALITEFDALGEGLPVEDSLCFAGDVLYDVKQQGAATTVRAWHLAADTLELAATYELGYRAGYVAGCRNNRILVTRAASASDPSSFNDFELITLQNGALTSVGLIEPPSPEGAFSNDYVALVGDEIYAKNCQMNYVTENVTNACYLYRFSIEASGSVELRDTTTLKVNFYHQRVLLTDAAIFTADGGLVDVLDKATSNPSYVANIAPTARHSLSSRNTAWFLSDVGLWTYPSTPPVASP